MSKPIAKEIVINAEQELIWKAWTEEQRITLWFAPLAHIEPRVGGKYELMFDPSNQDRMGTKGCTILELEEQRKLVFEWKGPDHLAEVMNQGTDLTTVSVELSPESNGTQLRLVHSGWGDSSAWAEARDWHIAAWDQVLGSLKNEIESGQGVLCCK